LLLWNRPSRPLLRQIAKRCARIVFAKWPVPKHEGLAIEIVESRRTARRGEQQRFAH
jgi:hypothetical protein